LARYFIREKAQIFCEHLVITALNRQNQSENIRPLSPVPVAQSGSGCYNKQEESGNAFPALPKGRFFHENE